MGKNMSQLIKLWSIFNHLEDRSIDLRHILGKQNVAETSIKSRIKCFSLAEKTWQFFMCKTKRLLPNVAHMAECSTRSVFCVDLMAVFLISRAWEVKKKGSSGSVNNTLCSTTQAVILCRPTHTHAQIFTAADAISVHGSNPANLVVIMSVRQGMWLLRPTDCFTDKSVVIFCWNPTSVCPQIVVSIQTEFALTVWTFSCIPNLKCSSVAQTSAKVVFFFPLYFWLDLPDNIFIFN